MFQIFPWAYGCVCDCLLIYWCQHSWWIRPYVTTPLYCLTCGFLVPKKDLLLTNNLKRCRMKSAFVHSVLSTQYKWTHFNTVLIRVLLYNCAMRGDFLPSLKPPLSVLLLLHLQKLIVNTFGMYSLIFPFHSMHLI